MPCADRDVSVVMHSSKEISSNKDQHSHDSDSDTCSPFCACNCCGHHSFVSQMSFHIVENKSEIEIKLPECQSLLSSNYFGSIWQPPQINDVI